MICADTGLSAIANSEDRVAALARLNHANRQIVQQGGGLPKRVTITPVLGTSDVDVTGNATLASRFLAVDRVRASVSGTVYPSLKRSTPRDVVDSQAATTGTPTKYAFTFPTLYLDRPLDGTVSLLLDTRVGPLELVESSAVADVSETSPTSIPAIWHERLLASLACVLVLERYEGREQDAAYHRKNYQDALEEYRMARAREGGEEMPSATGLFDTPDRLDSR